MMKFNTPPSEAPVALIPSGGLFEGQVAVVGETVVAGAVRGSLRGPGELHLTNGAHIEGVVDCEVARIEGHVLGPITARQRAILGAGAHFEGDLEAPTLEVHDDAVWNGVARVGEAP